jgi:hypothetical protein
VAQRDLGDADSEGGGVGGLLAVGADGGAARRIGIGEVVFEYAADVPVLAQLAGDGETETGVLRTAVDIEQLMLVAIVGVEQRAGDDAVHLHVQLALRLHVGAGIADGKHAGGQGERRGGSESCRSSTFLMRLHFYYSLRLLASGTIPAPRRL